MRCVTPWDNPEGGWIHHTLVSLPCGRLVRSQLGGQEFLESHTLILGLGSGKIHTGGPFSLGRPGAESPAQVPVRSPSCATQSPTIFLSGSISPAHDGAQCWVRGDAFITPASDNGSCSPRAQKC